jgi:hypothetical protein
LQKNIYNGQLSKFAAENGFLFWDGYQMFDTIDRKQLQQYHLAGDMHWNRKASQLFAHTLFCSDVLRKTYKDSEHNKFH